MDTFNSTTVLLVRRDGKVCMASDGQVTMNQSTIVKGGARKVRRVGKGKVLVGFAGGGADALALVGRLEEKLEEFNGNLERAVVELAKDWRTDRALRQLLAIGSGANFALAAARALLRHTPMGAQDVVREAMRIAAEICIFTNDHLTVEELSETP
jgi:ATP-dependent HslUV protease subunit HslV